MNLLADAIDMIEPSASVQVVGRVAEVRGLAVRVADFPAPVGSTVLLRPSRGASPALSPSSSASSRRDGHSGDFADACGGGLGGWSGVGGTGGNLGGGG